MKKHYFKIISFLLCFILSFSSIPVYAAHGRFHTQEENKAFWELNFRMLVTDFLGFVTGADLYTPYLDSLKRKHQFQTDSEAWAWLYDNTTVDNPDNPKEYTITNELKADLKSFVDEYKADLDSQKAYTYKTTWKPETLIKPDSFYTQKQYDNLLNYVKQLAKKHDYLLMSGFRTGYNYVGTMFIYGCSVSQLGLVGNCPYIEWTDLGVYNDVAKDNACPLYVYNVYDDEKYEFISFKDFSYNADTISTYYSGKGTNTITFFRTKGSSTSDTSYYNASAYNITSSGLFFNGDSGFQSNLTNKGYLITSNGQKIKSYTSLQDLKEYQSNNVTYPYYMVTPTCSGNTITQSQIDNSVTYGDIDNSVVNIIINNGGITEEQLQRIIDAILAGKGGGSDPVTPVDPTDPVNPVEPTDPWVPPSFDFTGLLKGLMNLLAAIFGLISNLVGYVAQLIADLLLLGLLVFLYYLLHCLMR